MERIISGKYSANLLNCLNEDSEKNQQQLTKDNVLLPKDKSEYDRNR